MATAHTGPIVMMNGRIVSLAELELRSKASKTATVPYSKKMSATASQPAVFRFMARGMVDRGRVLSLA